MGKPVRICSGPSSSMIAVPEAVLFPRNPAHPVTVKNCCIRPGGNPDGKVGNSLSRTSPASSQCPVVLSFPRDRCAIRPKNARGVFVGRTPSIGRILPNPQASSTGSRSPPTVLAVLARVLLPSSPYRAASGSSPTPTPSRTIRSTLPVLRRTPASRCTCRPAPGAH